MKHVSIGPGMFISQRKDVSLMEQYLRKQAQCLHPRRDPRGTCYDCGKRKKLDENDALAEALVRANDKGEL